MKEKDLGKKYKGTLKSGLEDSTYPKFQLDNRNSGQSRYIGIESWSSMVRT